MVLLDKDLEWVLGSNWAEELKTISRHNIYSRLNEARNNILQTKFQRKRNSNKRMQNRA
jgi:hypothetical protein